MSYSVWPHGLQHPRLSCPLPTPRIYSHSCPLSQWCHPTISSSVVPFCSCLQSFPASGSFPMSWLFASGGQSIRVSTSAKVLPVNIQGWFPLWLSGLITWFSRVFSSTTVWKASILQCSAFFLVQLSYLYMTTGKPIALIIWTFVCKLMSVLLYTA